MFISRISQNIIVFITVIPTFRFSKNMISLRLQTVTVSENFKMEMSHLSLAFHLEMPQNSILLRASLPSLLPSLLQGLQCAQNS